MLIYFNTTYIGDCKTAEINISCKNQNLLVTAIYRSLNSTSVPDLFNTEILRYPENNQKQKNHIIIGDTNVN